MLSGRTNGPRIFNLSCWKAFAFSEVVILRRRFPPSMCRAHIQFPPLLAGAIGCDAHDYEGQEQKQRNGVPRPMFCTGFGIVPIFALIRLGHFKCLNLNDEPADPTDEISYRRCDQQRGIFGYVGTLHNFRPPMRGEGWRR